MKEVITLAKRVKVVSFAVPQSKKEANALLSRIGVRNAELERIQSGLDTVIAEATESAARKSEPVVAERDGMVQAFAAYCEAHRDELTQDGKTKTAKFLAGEVNWRFTPPKVTLKGVDAVIAAIRARRLGKRFLRVKVEVNKEAMLAEPKLAQSIPGVSIGQREELIIRPNKGGELVGMTTKLPAA